MHDVASHRFPHSSKVKPYRVGSGGGAVFTELLRKIIEAL